MPLKKGGIYLNVHSDSGSLEDANYEFLENLAMFVEEGNLRTYIDREYFWNDIIEAHTYVDLGHKKGNVVITLF